MCKSNLETTFQKVRIFIYQCKFCSTVKCFNIVMYFLQHDFREYPSLLRQALSLARRLQEPLVEFAQLCNPDEDILSLKYHTLQVGI